MFPFKICSAVEFLRIKLWSHQKTEGRDQYFNRWACYWPATKPFFSPCLSGEILCSFLGFPAASPTVCDMFLFACETVSMRVSADSVAQHTHFRVHEVKDPVGRGGGGFLRTSSFLSFLLKLWTERTQALAQKWALACFFFTLSDATQEAVWKVRRIRELCFWVLFKTTSPGADCGGLASLVVPHLRGALWCFGWLPVLGLQSGGTLSDTAVQPVRR